MNHKYLIIILLLIYYNNYSQVYAFDDHVTYRKLTETAINRISTGDHISTTHPGTAVINSDGFYPGMYNMRGKLMWWGAGYVLENLVYAYDWNGPIDDTCSWSVLQ